MVEIFNVNITQRMNADLLESWLIILFPDFDFNFDLSDQEYILRVQAKNERIDQASILKFTKSLGYDIQLLK